MEQYTVTPGGVDVRKRANCFVRACLRMQLAYNFAQTDAALWKAGGLPCDIDDCEVAMAPMSGGEVTRTAGHACTLGNDTVEIDYDS
jgi:hypothetical protein